MSLRLFLEYTYYVLARMFTSSGVFISMFTGFFAFVVVVSIPCILRCFLWPK